VKARPAVDVTVGKGDRPVGVTVADATDGARVTAVARGSAASRAGLRVGDVIVSVAGTEVRSSREWTEASASLRVPEAPIVVRRGTDRIEFTLRWEGQASAAGRPRALARRLPAGTDRPGFRAGSLDRAATATETRASCT
jgi:predicted metalloprotease with PDZ domain